MIKNIIDRFMSFPLTGFGIWLILIGFLGRFTKTTQNPFEFKKWLQSSYRTTLYKDTTVDDYNLNNKIGGMLMIIFGIISILIALIQSIFSK